MTDLDRLEEIEKFSRFSYLGNPRNHLLSEENAHFVFSLARRTLEAEAAPNAVEAAAQAFKSAYGPIDIRSVRTPTRAALTAAKLHEQAHAPKPADRLPSGMVDRVSRKLSSGEGLTTGERIAIKSALGLIDHDPQVPKHMKEPLEAFDEYVEQQRGAPKPSDGEAAAVAVSIARAEGFPNGTGGLAYAETAKAAITALDAHRRANGEDVGALKARIAQLEQRQRDNALRVARASAEAAEKADLERMAAIDRANRDAARFGEEFAEMRDRAEKAEALVKELQAAIAKLKPQTIDMNDRHAVAQFFRECSEMFE